MVVKQFPSRRLNILPGKRYVVRTEGMSSAVVSVAYELDKRALDLEYPSGERYRYFDVAPEEFEAMLRAESIGLHVNNEFKPRHPHYQQL